MEAPDVIARIPHLNQWPVESIEIQRLGGLTNHNFRLTANGLDCILRLPRQSTNKYINREAELHNLNSAVAAGLAPPYRHFDQTGIMLSDNLPDSCELDIELLQEANLFKQLGQQLRRVHECQPVFKGQVDLRQLIERYFLLMSADHQAALADEHEEIKGLLNEQADGLQGRLVSSHNDLVLQNILLQENRLWLIDWEYSSLASPCWDIATVCNELTFDNAQAEEFLSFYSGGERGISEQQLHIYRRLLGFLSDCWLRTFNPPC